MISHSSCSTMQWRTCQIQPLSKTRSVSKSPSRGLPITMPSSVMHSAWTGMSATMVDRQVPISIHPSRHHSRFTTRWERSWNPAMPSWTPSPGNGMRLSTRSPSMAVLARFCIRCHTMSMATRGLLQTLTIWGPAIQTPNLISLLTQHP